MTDEVHAVARQAARGACEAIERVVEIRTALLEALDDPHASPTAIYILLSDLSGEGDAVADIAEFEADRLNRHIRRAREAAHGR